MPTAQTDRTHGSSGNRGIRSVKAGLFVNATLVIVKIGTGILGNSYALIADGIESSTDIFSSLIVWRGLSVARRSADTRFHFGYGKAETLAAATVSITLLAAAVIVAIQATREILTPHHLPAPYTLIVLAGVILIKEVLFRRVLKVGEEEENLAVKTDAWHHRSDAITSAAAFVGIAVALIGGQDWAQADDYAALLASAIIGFNGFRLLKPALFELMDVAPDTARLDAIRRSSASVAGVICTEKLRARRAGHGLFVDLHVHADPEITLFESHELAHRVKQQILADVPSVIDVDIHMEPYREDVPPPDAQPSS